MSCSIFQRAWKYMERLVHLCGTVLTALTTSTGTVPLLTRRISNLILERHEPMTPHRWRFGIDRQWHRLIWIDSRCRPKEIAHRGLHGLEGIKADLQDCRTQCLLHLVLGNFDHDGELRESPGPDWSKRTEAFSGAIVSHRRLDWCTFRQGRCRVESLQSPCELTDRVLCGLKLRKRKRLHLRPLWIRPIADVVILPALVAGHLATLGVGNRKVEVPTAAQLDGDRRRQQRMLAAQ